MASSTQPHNTTTTSTNTDNQPCNSLFNRLKCLYTTNATFYRLHFTYIVTVGLIGSIIIYLTSPISYIDALYMSTSAVCVTGLASMDIENLSKASQAVLWIEMMMGSVVFLSIVPVVARRRVFSQFVKDKMKDAQKGVLGDDELRKMVKEQGLVPLAEEVEEIVEGNEDLVQKEELIHTFTMHNMDLSNADMSAEKQEKLKQILDHVRTHPSEHLIEEVSGVEYQALRFLEKVVPLYFVICQVVIFVVIITYIKSTPYVSNLLDSRKISHEWFSMFISVSLFNNVGLTLLNDSLVPFVNQPFLLIFGSISFLLGNTCFPLVMWVIVKSACVYHQSKKIRSPETLQRIRVYQYLLDHPRRCFTHLFSGTQTLWLLVVFLFLNGAQFVLTLVTDLETSPYFQLVGIDKLVNAWFHSASTRVAGFQAISFDGLRPVNVFFYVAMMYVSVYPVTLSIRQSNTYQDREIGMYRPTEDSPLVKRSDVVLQARKLFFDDIFWLFIAMFCILWIEGDIIANNPKEMPIFHVIFEIFSAYGCVGYSLGYPGVMYSLSGIWQTGSKLIIIAIMLLGRHRGLPDSIDHAVQLPSRDKIEARVITKDGREIQGIGFITQESDIFHRTMSNGPTATVHRQGNRQYPTMPKSAPVSPTSPAQKLPPATAAAGKPPLPPLPFLRTVTMVADDVLNDVSKRRGGESSNQNGGAMGWLGTIGRVGRGRSSSLVSTSPTKSGMRTATSDVEILSSTTASQTPSQLQSTSSKGKSPSPNHSTYSPSPNHSTYSHSPNHSTYSHSPLPPSSPSTTQNQQHNKYGVLSTLGFNIREEESELDLTPRTRSGASGQAAAISKNQSRSSSAIQGNTGAASSSLPRPSRYSTVEDPHTRSLPDADIGVLMSGNFGGHLGVNSPNKKTHFVSDPDEIALEDSSDEGKPRSGPSLT